MFALAPSLSIAGVVGAALTGLTEFRCPGAALLCAAIRLVRICGNDGGEFSTWVAEIGEFAGLWERLGTEM